VRNVAFGADQDMKVREGDGFRTRGQEEGNSGTRWRLMTNNELESKTNMKILYTIRRSHSCMKMN
jgi:hypothetical protein